MHCFVFVAALRQGRQGPSSTRNLNVLRRRPAARTLSGHVLRHGRLTDWAAPCRLTASTCCKCAVPWQPGVCKGQRYACSNPSCPPTPHTLTACRCDFLSKAPAGSAVLLHACAHNPTGEGACLYLYDFDTNLVSGRLGPCGLALSC